MKGTGCLVTLKTHFLWYHKMMWLDKLSLHDQPIKPLIRNTDRRFVMIISCELLGLSLSNSQQTALISVKL